jgi:tRNA uridine 5-carboxymethylaminomethyl modification enzyme
LVDDERWEFYSEKKIRIEEELQFLHRTWVQPNTDRAERINRLLEKPISREYSLADLLARPRVEHGPLLAAYNGEPDSSDGKAYKAQAGIEAQSTQQAEIQIKYQGYIDRQEEDIERLKKQENTKLPADFNYQQMQGLSNELKQKLLEAKPENIGRASRIPGITPAAISLLLIYLKKHRSVNRKAG